jgi:hypothetical protein
VNSYNNNNSNNSIDRLISNSSNTPKTQPSNTAATTAAFLIDITEDKPKSINKKITRKPKNLFSDETALWLAGLIRGKKNLSIEIEGVDNYANNNFRNDNSDDVKAVKKDTQEILAAAIREKCLPCFWSLFIHFCILVILAIIFLPLNRPDELYEIIVMKTPAADDLVQGIAGVNGDQSQDTQPVIIAPPVQIPAPNPQPSKQTTSDHNIDSIPLTQSSEIKPTLSIATERNINRRNKTANGNNDSADAAIRAALNWLVRVQNPDGSWGLCGNYRDAAPSNKENRIAATAMALLAFQGYGVTPEADDAAFAEYILPVRKGWKRLLEKQESSGCFFDDKLPFNDRFYTHGICTIAICERLAMTGNEVLREPARKAVEYCVRYQSIEGGWRYAADRYSAGADVSVTGWIVMALMTAEMANIPVEKNVFDNVNKFLDTVAQDNGSKYSYRNARGEGIRKSMTAEALYCRELIGWKRTDVRLVKGLKFLVEPENLPTFKQHYNRNAYYWFYASLALHNYGGEIWKKWDNDIKKIIIENQEIQGEETGSWNPNKPAADEWGRQYGRLYTTCMLIYILETNYRYKPIYDEINQN